MEEVADAPEVRELLARASDRRCGRQFAAHVLDSLVVARCDEHLVPFQVGIEPVDLKKCPAAGRMLHA